MKLATSVIYLKLFSSTMKDQHITRETYTIPDIHARWHFSLNNISYCAFLSLYYREISTTVLIVFLNAGIGLVCWIIHPH